MYKKARGKGLQDEKMKPGKIMKATKGKMAMHKMPNGKMMKDSAHKGMKKMKSGGSVKKGCDGVATKGKTKGRMM